MLTLFCCRESQSDDENVCALLRKWKDEGLDDFVQISVRYVWFQLAQFFTDCRFLIT